jgi:imidazolonepropionase-like amidohydrolase
MMALIFQLTKALQEAGAGLLAGTDHGSPGGVEPVPVSEELRVMVERAGLTPYEALATATRNPAAFLGTLDSTGTVAVGKRADLVLLAGNPLQDIRAAAVPSGVMVGGRWFTRAELDARVQAATAATPAKAVRAKKP